MIAMLIQIAACVYLLALPALVNAPENWTAAFLYRHMPIALGALLLLNAAAAFRGWPA